MRSYLLLAAVGLAGCAHVSTPVQSHEQFFASVSQLCGQAFEGNVTSPTVEADASFAGKKLVMHVRECSEDTIRIPFHVGDDRSRTWVISRTDGQLSLRHDHRHEDGTPDTLTQYGGVTVAPGTAVRQEFPADGYSVELFVRNKIPQSATNVWAMEAGPQIFAYELRRPGRFFRVEFDITQARIPPPPPWGSR